MPTIEKHPWNFFLPENARILMLGSFPPPQNRWSINFYYPNIQNDMWRIMGIIFYNDKNYFLKNEKSFNEIKIKNFCIEKGIALGDTAQEIIRQKNNASDNFLQVIKSFDLKKILTEIKSCNNIVVTGGKALQTLQNTFTEIKSIDTGAYTDFKFESRLIRLFRMPSSSKAYPKPLLWKAEKYNEMFKNII